MKEFASNRWKMMENNGNDGKFTENDEKLKKRGWKFSSHARHANMHQEHFLSYTPTSKFQTTTSVNGFSFHALFSFLLVYFLGFFFFQWSL